MPGELCEETASMKLLFLLSVVSFAHALNEHVINKRVLPTNFNCDPNSKICRKGDWVAQHIADCVSDSSSYFYVCDAQNDVSLSWTVDVAVGDYCKPVTGKKFKCGAPGTNTRCVCSDVILFPSLRNECRCQYWPPEDFGAHSPAFCTGYYTGGTSGISGHGLHHWACCNNCKDNTSRICDGITWHGGSSYSYCDTCGQNTGGGRVEYYFNCGSCDHQNRCSNKCSWYNHAFLCWKWLECFQGCCLESIKQVRNKRDISELAFCGDGNCSETESPDSCPADCCYQMNSVNCTKDIKKCSPVCCRTPNCCLETNTNTNTKPGLSNPGVIMGSIATLLVTAIISTAVVTICVHYIRTCKHPRNKKSGNYGNL